MSRHTRYSNDRRFEVSYGNDRTCGFFLQVFDTQVNRDIPVVDVDQAPWTKNKADPTTFPEVAAKYGVTITEDDIRNS
jgi:hypothetical protein